MAKFSVSCSVNGREKANSFEWGKAIMIGGSLLRYFVLLLILVFCLYWVFETINKFPGDLLKMRSSWEEGDRQEFIADVAVFAFYWVVTIGMIVFIFASSKKSVGEFRFR
jgi:hypothetical protein